MTLSLLWPIGTVCATCSIYKKHSSSTVFTRDTKVLVGVLFLVVAGENIEGSGFCYGLGASLNL
jgi:hypothetical protein